MFVFLITIFCACGERAGSASDKNKAYPELDTITWPYGEPANPELYIRAKRTADSSDQVIKDRMSGKIPDSLAQIKISLLTDSLNLLKKKMGADTAIFDQYQTDRLQRLIKWTAENNHFLR